MVDRAVEVEAVSRWFGHGDDRVDALSDVSFAVEAVTRCGFVRRDRPGRRPDREGGWLGADCAGIGVEPAVFGRLSAMLTGTEVTDVQVREVRLEEAFAQVAGGAG